MQGAKMQVWRACIIAHFDTHLWRADMARVDTVGLATTQTTSIVLTIRTRESRAALACRRRVASPAATEYRDLLSVKSSNVTFTIVEHLS